MLAEVIMHWYKASLTAWVRAWSIQMDKLMFHASIYWEKEVIFLGLAARPLDGLWQTVL